MKKICILIISLLFFGFSVQAQKYTISGYVKDASTGEMLLGASVFVPKLKLGATSNAYGFYSITLDKDSVGLIVRFIGYKPVLKKVYLDRNIVLDLALDPVQLNEVVITGNKAKENVDKPQMGVIDVPIQSVKELPAIFGEKDLFKVLQLLPGVQAGSEASAGFYVRGGGADENLVLLDEAVIYNPFHLAGFFSIFNGDAIKSVSLIKGGFPAQYGGRLSSIIDISMKDGNDKTFHGEGGIGLIASRLTFEGPILKDKASFMVSARRTYIDVLMKPFLPQGTDAGYYFYDLNAKLNYKISENDRIFLSGYLGKDVVFTNLTQPNDTTAFGIDWGNKSATARWNHIFSPKLFANTSFIYNDYVFAISTQFNALHAKIQSGIRDIGGKTDFDWYPTPLHHVKFGGTYTYQKFIPSLVEGQTDNLSFTQEQVKFVHTAAAYINDEYTWSDKIAFNIGLRTPLFVYKQTKYFNVEPRFTVKYALDKTTSLKAGYAMMNQFIHLLTNSTLASPMDLWVPSSDIVKPQQSHQVSAGIFKNFLNDKYETSAEIYYKTSKNLIEYAPGTEIFLNPDIDKTLIFGNGWAYGLELFVKKNEGKITGWFGYTLSFANRQFAGINNGNPYPATYDRRHDFSLTGIYNFNKNWSFSAVFVYGTGHALTIPVGSYYVPILDGNQDIIAAKDMGAKNFYTLRDYNRLDIGIKYVKQHKNYEDEWRLDIYNMYSRRNPYFVYIDENYYDKNANINKPAAMQVSLFPIIPTISYNFKF
jgi:hypothetical protein